MSNESFIACICLNPVKSYHWLLTTPVNQMKWLIKLMKEDPPSVETSIITTPDHGLVYQFKRQDIDELKKYFDKKNIHILVSDHSSCHHNDDFGIPDDVEIVQEYDRIKYYKHNQLHRDNDEPAVIYDNGDKEWWFNGKLTRDGDQPAITFANGTKIWYKDNHLHRDGDEPALVRVNGDKRWYKNGKLHRDGDEPAVIHANGDKEWYKDNILHRDGDEPALVRTNGDKEWCKNGLCHRDEDQPAVIHANGDKYWYLNGVKYEPNKKIIRTVSKDGTGWTLNGKLHNDNDQPAIILANGDKEWYNNGLRHRDGDEPAVILAKGYKAWYKDGKVHRDGDKPAIIYSDDSKDWFSHGTFIKHEPKGVSISKTPLPDATFRLETSSKIDEKFTKLVDSLNPEDYTKLVSMAETLNKKAEVVKQGSKSILANLSMFSSSEIEDLIEKNPDAYKDTVSQFKLGFVLEKFAKKIHETLFSSIVMGIMTGVEKKVLLIKFNKVPVFTGLTSVLETILLSADPYPSKKEFVEMLYDKCNYLKPFIQMYILTMIDVVKYTKHKENFSNIIMTAEEFEYFYMIKDC